MSMSNGNTAAGEENGSIEISGSAEPGRASLIEVSYTDDGSGVAAMPLAILRPGDELIWHTAMNEGRAFAIRLAEDFPIDTGTGGAPVYALSVSSSASVPVVTEPVGTSVVSDGLLRSAVQQTITIRIRRDASEGTYGYELEADVPAQTKGVAFAGGVIIRPPPRPNP